MVGRPRSRRWDLATPANGTTTKERSNSIRRRFAIPLYGHARCESEARRVCLCGGKRSGWLRIFGAVVIFDFGIDLK